LASTLSVSFLRAYGTFPQRFTPFPAPSAAAIRELITHIAFTVKNLDEISPENADSWPTLEFCEMGIGLIGWKEIRNAQNP
jgi:hypothetical protein